MEASSHAAQQADGAPAMSVEQLKEGMFRSIRDTGTVELIRAQLRRRFIEKLRQQNGATRSDSRSEEGRDASMNQVGRDAEVTPDEKLVHGLVAEFLAVRSLENSLAVFVPEIGGSRNQVDSATILKMLRLNPDTQQKFELERAQTGKSLLSVLVQELVRRCQLAKMDSGTQTAMDCFDHRIVLENQLRRVENTYMEECATQKVSPQQSIEERMITYQREYDAICDKRLQEELERYKATEVAMVRAEERKKFNREVDALRASLFQEHRDKLDRLQEREREMEMAFVAKRTELETSLFETRQSLFKEMERLRVKEAELQVKVERDFRHFSGETQRLQLWEESVRTQEASLESMVAQAMAEKERAWKLERQREFHDIQKRQDELLERETALEIETGTRKDLKTRASALQQEIGALEGALSKSNDEVRLAQKTSGQLEREKKWLEAAVAEMKARTMQEEQTLRDANSTSARLAAEKGSLEDELIRYKQRNVEAEDLLKHTSAEVKDLQQQILTLKLEEANSVAQERKKLMDLLDEERDRFHWKEGELVAKVRDAQRRLAETEALAEKYQSQYEDEKLHVESLRHDVSSLNSLLTQAQATITAKHGTPQHFSSHRNQRSSPGASDGEATAQITTGLRNTGSEYAFMMQMMQMMASLRDGTAEQQPHLLVNQGAGTQGARDSQEGTSRSTELTPSIGAANEDEEARLLKEDQARIEREMLETREYEKRKQAMLEKQEQEIAERQKQFDEDLARKRQERLEEEERLGAERRKRIAEEESKLQEELEKQRAALQKTTALQKQMAEERLAEETRRFQEQQAYNERRRAEEAEFAEEMEAKRRQQQVHEEEQRRKQERQANEQEAARREAKERLEEEERQRIVAAQREEETTRQEEFASRKEVNAREAEMATQEEEPRKLDDTDDALEGAASGNGSGYAHFENLDSASEEGTGETARADSIVKDEEPRSTSADDKLQSDVPALCEDQDGPDATLDASSPTEHDHAEAGPAAEESSPPQVESAVELPCEVSALLPEAEVAPLQDDVAELFDSKTVEDNVATQTPAVLDVPTKTPEELEEEKHRAAEEEKKKQDEAEIDVYRQRVLARKAAEKERQRELEAAAERERKAEAEAASNHHSYLGNASDSEEELELSGGSFAESSAASNSDSF